MLQFKPLFFHRPLSPHSVTTLPLSTVLPWPMGHFPPASASNWKEVLGRVLHYAGERCASSSPRRKEACRPPPVSSPPRRWWVALGSHLGSTVPALLKRVGWTEVETEPEVQGVWAVWLGWAHQIIWYCSISGRRDSLSGIIVIG